MPKSRRASRPRFRLLPTILLTVAILCVPTAVYAWGRTSSSFEIQRVVVSGAKVVPEKRLQRVLRQEYRGDNLFAVSAGAVRATLSPFCFVADARVDRDFPDTLRVEITEHEPVAYALAGKEWYVISGGGYVIGSAEEAACGKVGAVSRRAGSASDGEPTPNPLPSTAMTAATADGAAGAADGGSTTSTNGGSAEERLAPLLAGPRHPAFDLPRLAVTGQPRRGDTLVDRRTVVALRVILALPEGQREALAAVQVADGQITLQFSQGLTVIWGDAARTRAKALSLCAVLQRYEASGRRCTFMDVSVPDRVLGQPVLK